MCIVNRCYAVITLSTSGLWLNRDVVTFSIIVAVDDVSMRPVVYAIGTDRLNDLNPS
jgi:hypothetical protein